MDKGLYVIYSELDEKGVNKKIKFQIEALKSKGFDIDTYVMENRLVPMYQIRARLPFCNIMPEWKMIPNVQEYKFLYMRRPGYLNDACIKWLSNLKRVNPRLQIFMEFPTFPYDKEFSGIKDYPFLLMDKKARKRLKGIVDYLTTPGLKEIQTDISKLGVEAVNIINPYDFSSIRNKKYIDNNGIIEIAVVARFCQWHGYERLIKGLSHYYSNNDYHNRFVLHFVGDGPELNKYKDLSIRLDLRDSVKFYGFLEIEQILEVYDKCVLAADVFGGYKKNLKCSCSLKSREYLAAGLPIITGSKMDIQDFESLFPYVCKFPDDDTPVDFNEVLVFLNSIYGKIDQASVIRIENDIRKKAKEVLDYRMCLDEVVDKIQ